MGSAQNGHCPYQYIGNYEKLNTMESTTDNMEWFWFTLINGKTDEELAARLKKLKHHIKDCSDIGLTPDADVSTEMNFIVDVIMMRNGLDGTEDGDSCDDEFC